MTLHGLILLQILLNINSSTVSKKYAHVLAFNEKGRKTIKSSKIKLYSSIKPKDTLSNKALREDVLSDDIYSVLTEKIINRKGDDICPMEKAVKDINDLSGLDLVLLTEEDFALILSPFFSSLFMAPSLTVSHQISIIIYSRHKRVYIEILVDAVY